MPCLNRSGARGERPFRMDIPGRRWRRVITLAVLAIVLFSWLAVPANAQEFSAASPLAADRPSSAPQPLPEQTPSSTPAAPEGAAEAAPPSGAALREAVRSAMRRSHAVSEDIEPELVRELVAVHGQLEGDQQLSSHDRRRLSRAVGDRLIKIGRSIERRQQREEAVKDRERAGSAEHSASESLTDNAVAATGSETGVQGGGGGQAGDEARALIELIQNTVSPASWDVNGGQGTIMYYAPLRVLVVRQTGEVHRRIGGVIGGLRQ